MMKNTLSIVMLLCLLSAWTSCKKAPGYGGLASIIGKVYVYDYNNSNVLEAEGYTADMDVYISTEETPGQLDKVGTDINGAYLFDGLRKGSYTVWVFEDCDKCTDNKQVVKQSVNIEKNNSRIELPDFKIKI
jgi:hypothetical protein